MGTLVILMALVLLVLTAPVWIPAMAIMGVVGTVAVVAANHAEASAPAAAPAPCAINARWVGEGDANDPRNWEWMWVSDGNSHPMSIAPPCLTEERSRAWLAKNGANPANAAFVANVARAWGIAR